LLFPRIIIVKTTPTPTRSVLKRPPGSQTTT
jgi:hypothetical protein